MKLALSAVFFIASVLMQAQAGKHFTFRNTPLFSKDFSEVARYSDFWLVLFGHRRIAADIVFIQTLQYYGSIHEDEISAGAKAERGGGFGTGLVRYDKLFSYSLRAVRLDRNFEYAVTFTAAALAWVQKRENEAIVLLTDAIDYWDGQKMPVPVFYQSSLYLSAIAVTKEKGISEATEYMEKAIIYPDCPDMVKNILGEIYFRAEDYKNAARVLEMNLDSRDPGYRLKAREKLEKIHELLISGQQRS
ncbi:MAG: hypothetical protein ABII20_07305 [Candidatus Omnitrophota bacterium]|nr:hypothetical protein [bacterium]MBU3930313.1 hypothetical protein [bacterium]